MRWERRAKDPEVKIENGKNKNGDKTKKNSRPEGSICKRFAYLANSDVYPNWSDMNELSEIRF